MLSLLYIFSVIEQIMKTLEGYFINLHLLMNMIFFLFLFESHQLILFKFAFWLLDFLVFHLKKCIFAIYYQMLCNTENIALFLVRFLIYFFIKSKPWQFQVSAVIISKWKSILLNIERDILFSMECGINISKPLKINF